MPVHKRPDSQYWQIRFKIAGRTVRRATGVTDRAAAEELEENLRRALWRQIKLGERHFTWDQAVERCTAEDSTQNSWERTLRSIERLNRFLTGAPLAEITRENIVKIRTALTRHTYLNADKKPVPLAPATGRCWMLVQWCRCSASTRWTRFGSHANRRTRSWANSRRTPAVS